MPVTQKPYFQKPFGIFLGNKVLLTIVFSVLCFLFFFQTSNSFATNSTSTDLGSDATSNEKKVKTPSLRERYEFFLTTAQRYKEAENHEFAIGFFRKALNIKPNQLEIIKEIGLSYMAIGKFKDALNYFQKASDLDPSNEEIKNYLNDAKWLLDAEKGNIPDTRHNLPLQESTINGIRFYYDGRYEEAIQQFQESLKKIPYDLKALTIGGHSYVEIGKYKEAIDFYNRALALQPTSKLLLASKQSAVAKMQTQPLLQKNSNTKLQSSDSQSNSTLTQQTNPKTSIEKLDSAAPATGKNPQEKAITNSTNTQPTSNTLDTSSGVISKEQITDSKKIVIQNPTSTIQKRGSDKKGENNTPTTIKDLTIKTATCFQSFCFLKSKSSLQIGPVLNYTISTNMESLTNNNTTLPRIELESHTVTAVKDSTKLWLSSKISDTEFLSRIEGLVNNHDTGIEENLQQSIDTQSDMHIPKWIKKMAFFWTSNHISDEEFFMAIKWLYENEIFIDTKIRI